MSEKLLAVQAQHNIELIEDAAIKAAKELLAGWPMDEVPIKWKNELDWQSGSARCRENGVPWIEAENIQATATQAAIYSSKQSAKGFVRFAINVQLGTGDSILRTIMNDLNRRFVGKAVGSIYFLTSHPRPSESEAEYFVASAGTARSRSAGSCRRGAPCDSGDITRIVACRPGSVSDGEHRATT